MLVGGLIVVPTMTDLAEAGCKPKKPKGTDFTTSDYYSHQMINVMKKTKHNI